MKRSVYTPGAGHSPRVLAGRDALLQHFELMLNALSVEGRVRADDLILAGPRGVGKTVTLTAFAALGRDSDYEVVNLQAAAGQAGLVESLVRRAQTRIRDNAGPWQRTKDAFDRLAGLNVGVAGVSAGISVDPGPDHVTRPDPGTLAETLASLATEIRRDRPNGGLLITLDEVQVAQHTDLALLAATLHRLNVDHPGAAVAFAGTGLPHTPDELRKAGVTHPDRLFVLEPLPLTLSADEAAYAIVEPARRAGVAWHPGAVEALVVASNGYPAHVQLFAHETWVGAPGPHTITVADAHAALPRAADRLEKRTLGPRWDRMPDRQMEFLAALAVNDGHARTGQLSRTLGRSVQELSWVRQALIEEGDVFAPRRGHLALTVPLMGRYIVDRYEQARAESGTGLLSLEELCANTRRPLASPATPDPRKPTPGSTPD